MKTKLLKKTMLFTILIVLSVNINAQSYSFEGLALADGAAITGWTGSFNSSAVYDTTEDALEYVRTNTNNSLRLDAPTTIDATATNYLRIKYKNAGKATQLRVKATAGTDDNGMTFTLSPDATSYVNKYFKLEGEASWDNAAESILIQFRADYAAEEAAIFIKEIEFLQIDPSTFVEVLGFESADEVEPGVIESNTNGNTTQTGWYIQNSDEWSFSETVTRTGDYSAVFDATTSGTVSKKMQGGGSTSPDNSKLDMAAGNWKVTAYVYVPTGKTAPEYLKFNAKDPINNFTMDIASDIAKDSWVLVESSIVNVTSANVDDGYNLIAAGRDTDSFMYVDDIMVTEEVPAGVAENKLEGVVVYPNPASEIVNVSAPVGSAISITNLTGVAVKQSIASAAQSTISIADLASGIYIINVVSEGKIAVSKLIKN